MEVKDIYTIQDIAIKSSTFLGKERDIESTYSDIQDVSTRTEENGAIVETTYEINSFPLLMLFVTGMTTRGVLVTLKGGETFIKHAVKLNQYFQKNYRKNDFPFVGLNKFKAKNGVYPQYTDGISVSSISEFGLKRQDIIYTIACFMSLIGPSVRDMLSNNDEKLIKIVSSLFKSKYILNKKQSSLKVSTSLQRISTPPIPSPISRQNSTDSNSSVNSISFSNVYYYMDDMKSATSVDISSTSSRESSSEKVTRLLQRFSSKELEYSTVMFYDERGNSQFRQEKGIIRLSEYKLCPIHSGNGMRSFAVFSEAQLNQVSGKMYACFSGTKCYDICHKFRGNPPVNPNEIEKFENFYYENQKNIRNFGTDSLDIESSILQYKKLYKKSGEILNLIRKKRQDLGEIVGDEKNTEKLQTLLLDIYKKNEKLPDLTSVYLNSSFFGCSQELKKFVQKEEYILKIHNYTSDDEDYLEIFQDSQKTMKNLSKLFKIDEYSEENLLSLITNLSDEKYEEVYTFSEEMYNILEIDPSTEREEMYEILPEYTDVLIKSISFAIHCNEKKRSFVPNIPDVKNIFKRTFQRELADLESFFVKAIYQDQKLIIDESTEIEIEISDLNENDIVILEFIKKRKSVTGQISYEELCSKIGSKFFKKYDYNEVILVEEIPVITTTHKSKVIMGCLLTMYSEKDLFENLDFSFLKKLNVDKNQDGSFLINSKNYTGFSKTSFPTNLKHFPLIEDNYDLIADILFSEDVLYKEFYMGKKLKSNYRNINHLIISGILKQIENTLYQDEPQKLFMKTNFIDNSTKEQLFSRREFYRSEKTTSLINDLITLDKRALLARNVMIENVSEVFLDNMFSGITLYNSSKHLEFQELPEQNIYYAELLIKERLELVANLKNIIETLINISEKESTNGYPLRYYSSLEDSPIIQTKKEEKYLINDEIEIEIVLPDLLLIYKDQKIKLTERQYLNMDLPQQLGFGQKYKIEKLKDVIDQEYINKSPYPVVPLYSDLSLEVSELFSLFGKEIKYSELIPQISTLFSEYCNKKTTPDKFNLLCRTIVLTQVFERLINKKRVEYKVENLKNFNVLVSNFGSDQSKYYQFVSDSIPNSQKGIYEYYCQEFETIFPEEFKTLESFLKDFNIIAYLYNFRKNFYDKYEEIVNSYSLSEYKLERNPKGKFTIYGENMNIKKISHPLNAKIKGETSGDKYILLAQRLSEIVKSLESKPTTSRDIDSNKNSLKLPSLERREKLLPSVKLLFDESYSLYSINLARKFLSYNVLNFEQDLIRSSYYPSYIAKNNLYPKSKEVESNFTNIYGDENTKEYSIKIEDLKGKITKLAEILKDIVDLSATKMNNDTLLTINKEALENKIKDLEQRFVFYSSLISGIITAYSGSSSVDYEQSGKLIKLISDFKNNYETLERNLKQLPILSMEIYLTLSSNFAEIYKIRKNLYENFGDKKINYINYSSQFATELQGILSTFLTQNYEEELRTKLKEFMNNSDFAFLDKNVQTELAHTIGENDTKSKSINRFLYIREYMKNITEKLNLYSKVGKKKSLREVSVDFYFYQKRDKSNLDLLLNSSGKTRFSQISVDIETEEKFQEQITYTEEIINEVLSCLNIINSGPGIHYLITTLSNINSQDYNEAFEQLKKCKKTVNFNSLLRNPKLESFVDIINGRMTNFSSILNKMELQKLSIPGKIYTSITYNLVMELFDKLYKSETFEKFIDNFEERNKEFLVQLEMALSHILDEYTLYNKKLKEYKKLDENNYLELLSKTFIVLEDGEWIRKAYTPMSSGNFLIPFFKELNAKLNKIIEDGDLSYKLNIIKSYANYIKNMELKFGQNNEIEEVLRERIN